MMIANSQGVFVLLLYLTISLIIGWFARRRGLATANDYLSATHVLPLWIVVISYLASNCGALEVVGLSAMAAEYGVQAFHFYWIGAIPALIFLALWMMPVYRKSNVTSVPQYLLVRFGPRMRLINACTTAIILLLLAGVSLYALAQVLTVAFGFSFESGILLCAFVTLAYILAGGIRATIYNEIFQFAVMLAGLVPLAIRSAHLLKSADAASPSSLLHLWRPMPLVSRQAPMDIVGVTFGLGFVLSFSYWCTDFVLMQRAFTARNEDAACQIPLWGGFGKLLFSFVTVIPGLAAYFLLPNLKGRYDQTLSLLMNHLYSPWMIAIGTTALVASLMSALAANVSAFAALWTQDIYRTTLRPNKDERHYLFVAHVAIVVAVLFGLIACYLNFLFSNLMEHIQLIFSVFAAPFWAIFLLGIFTRRASERGAMIGFLCGSMFSFVHSIAVQQRWIHYGSRITSTLYAAIYAFCIAAVFGWVFSNDRENNKNSPRMQIGKQGLFKRNTTMLVLSAILLVCCLALNILWR